MSSDICSTAPSRRQTRLGVDRLRRASRDAFAARSGSVSVARAGASISRRYGSRRPIAVHRLIALFQVGAGAVAQGCLAAERWAARLGPGVPAGAIAGPLRHRMRHAASAVADRHGPAQPGIRAGAVPGDQRMAGHDEWTQKDQRLKAAIVVPGEDAAAAVAEIEHWAGQSGISPRSRW